MPRLFTELVFDRTIRGTTEVFTSPTLNARLGEGDLLLYEIEVSEASGTTPTITVRHWHSTSNDDAGFKALPALWSAQSLASLPYRDVQAQAGAVKLAGSGKLGLALGNADNVARVRVWVTARSN